MSETLASLYQSIASRPAEFVVGWRAGAAVRNTEFLARVSAWRALLQRTAGQNFALYLNDSIEFGAALLGAWHAGKTVWLAADTMTLSVRALEHSVDGFLGEFPSEQTPLQPAVDEAASHDGFLALDRDFVALVVQTSGTTGAAQAIPKRLSQLSCEVATLESLFGPELGAADIVATVSHQHIYGLLFKVLWPLASGRSIHAYSAHFPEELAVVLAARPCVLIASPAHLKRLPSHLAWHEAARRLCAVFSSGGPLPLQVAQKIGKLLGQVPIEVYGSSETGGIAWRQRTAGTDDSWLPLPRVEWRIAPAQDLLEVRSPHLADADWLRVADCVQAHPGGRFLLNGRSDRIVKIEEKRVSLNAIEALLEASELVLSVRVVACAEEESQRQQLAAFIVASEQGKSVLASEGKLALNLRLRDLLAATLEPVALPRRWRYLDQMPIDAQGKITQALLLALLDQRPRTPHLRLLAHDAQRVLLEITVPADLYYFDGHFPQAAILPGVVQVDWAICNARQYFELPPQFRAIHALKFQRTIRPNTPVTLELVHDNQKGSLNFRYFSPAGQHASGRIQFTAAETQA